MNVLPDKRIQSAFSDWHRASGQKLDLIGQSLGTILIDIRRELRLGPVVHLMRKHGIGGAVLCGVEQVSKDPEHGVRPDLL